MYNIDNHAKVLEQFKLTPHEVYTNNICKFGARGDRISGFNFKKCSSTKFIYGSGMYTYTYVEDYKR